MNDLSGQFDAANHGQCLCRFQFVLSYYNKISAPVK